MDQFYFESGYIADGYYGFIAEATATLASAASLSAELTDTNLSYFAPDYIATDYFETTIREAIAITGMSFSVAAELTDTNESYFVPQYIDADYFEIPVGITQEAAAALTTTASITAIAGRIVSGQIALTSTGTYVLTAAVNKSTDISLSSQFTQSIAVIRTRTTAVALASEFTQSAIGIKAQTTAVALSSQFTQTAIADITKSSAVAVSSQFSQSTLASAAKDSAVTFASQANVNAQLSAIRQGKADLSSLTPDPATPSSGSDTGMAPFGAIANITKAFNAILESASAQSVSAVMTASAQLAAQSEFTSSTQAFRTKEFTITVSSLFTPSVAASALINQLSIMEASAAMSITAQATKAAVSALNVQATQSATNVRVRFSDSQLTSEFSSSAVATKQFADAVITIASAFTQTTQAAKTFGYSAALTSEFAQATQASKTFGYSASLVSEFAQSTQAAKTVGYSVSLASEFAQAAAAARTRNLESAQSVQSSVNATAFRIIENTVSITGAFTPTLTANVQRAGVALLETASTFQISAVANRSITLALENIGNLNAQAAKTVGYNSTVTATATLAASATKSVSASSTQSSAFTLSATAVNVQLAQAALVTTSSIYTTRYFGTPRPRDLVDVLGSTFSSSVVKFGSHSATGRGDLPYINETAKGTIPKQTQDFVFETWFRKNSTTTRTLVSWGTLSPNANAFFNISYLVGNVIRLRLYYNDSGQTDITSGQIADNTWYHLLIVKNNSLLSFYVNGTRVGTFNWTYEGGMWDWTPLGTPVYTNMIVNATSHYLDETSLHLDTTLGYNPSSTTITVPTAARVNDPATTAFLYHFNGNNSDDVSFIQLGAAALTSQFSVSATAQELSSSQANLATSASVSALGVVARSAVSSMASAATQSATATRIQSAASTISSESSVSALVGKIVPADSALTAASTQTTQVLRIRTNVIAITSAFTPTLTADVFKNHVASLTATSAVSAVISKTLNAASALTTAATLSATATKITRTLVALSSQVGLTVNGGKLKLATANITGVFNASIGVQYFEGTSLMAASAATISVSAIKTARITRTLSSAVTVTTVARSNPPLFPTSDYDIFPSRFTASFQWQFPRNVPDSNDDLIDFRMTAPSIVASIGGPLQVNYSNAQGDDYIFINIFYLKRIGTNQYQLFNGQLQFDINASTTNALSINVWRSFSVSVGSINQTTGNFTISATHPVSFTASSGGGGPSSEGGTIYNIKIAGSPAYVYAPFDLDNLPDGQIGSGTGQTTFIRNFAFTPIGTVYSYNYPKLATADLISLDFATLTATPQQLILATGTISSAASLIASAINIKGTTANISSAASQTTNASKTVRGAAALASAFATINNANRIKQFAGSLTANASLSATLSPVRRASAQLSSEFALLVDSDKRTGIVAALTATGSIVVDNIRVRDVNTAFTSIATNLTAAFKNARGTILLESAFTSSIQAQKITSPPQTFVSAFTQSALARKTARGTASITAIVTMSVIGIRVRRQAAALSSSLTSVITTTNSRLVRTSAAVLVETSQITLNTRTRGITKTLASTTALTCVFQVLITASAALNSQFTGLFIFGKRVNASATLESQGFQLTAGDIINFEPSLTYTIPQETRELQVRRESREYIIEQETRLLILLEG